MSQPPSTPVKVPSAAANYTPATLDADLRSQINSSLLRDGHVTKIQEALLHSLNANSSDWPSAIQAYALSLLRSGEVTTFPALLRRVLDDVREDTTLHGSGKDGKPGLANGKPVTNGNFVKDVNGAVGAGGRPNLAVPDAVVAEALKVTRESLEAVCEIGDEGSG